MTTVVMTFSSFARPGRGPFVRSWSPSWAADLVGRLLLLLLLFRRRLTEVVYSTASDGDRERMALITGCADVSWTWARVRRKERWCFFSLPLSPANETGSNIGHEDTHRGGVPSRVPASATSPCLS